MQQKEIRIKLGDDLSQEFVNFWKEEVDAGRIPTDLQARQTPQVRVRGMVAGIPSEVIVAFLTSAAGALGAGVGQFIWSKIKEFIDKKAPQSLPGEIVIEAGEVRIVVDPEKLKGEAPPELARLSE